MSRAGMRQPVPSGAGHSIREPPEVVSERHTDELPPWPFVDHRKHLHPPERDEGVPDMSQIIQSRLIATKTAIESHTGRIDPIGRLKTR